MKRRTTSAAIRAAAGSAMELESLELRRLLSGNGYSLTNTITDTVEGTAHATFGRSNLPVLGNLALIGSPGETEDTSAGHVSLVDTSTGAILHTFDNPSANPDAEFGVSMAFVAGKIAISAPGDAAVYIYDYDVSSNTYSGPVNEYDDLNGAFTVFGTTMAAQGNDLLVSALQSNPNIDGSNGEIFRFDVSSGNTTPTAEYFNPDTDHPNPGGNDQFGTALAADATHIYASAFVNDVSGHTAEVVVMNNDGSWVHTYSGATNDSQYGYALAAGANDNTFFLSSPSDGAVYHLNATGGAPIQTYNAIGASLAVNGSELLIGDGGTTANVYNIDSGDLDASIANPNPKDTLNDDQGEQDSTFSASAGALPDGGFLVSDFDANVDGVIDAGQVYVYEPATTTPPNTPPSDLAISGNNQVVTQQSDAFSGSFTDPDVGDTHTVAWDFGDGTVIAAHSTDDAGALTPSHVYTSTGNYTVTMTIEDSANASASNTFAVNVATMALEGTTLYIGGTTGDDVINVNKAADGQIKANVNSTGKEFFTATNVVIYGGDGNDDISVGTGITLPSDQYGGNGNDTLFGGGGNDYMDGGAGDDLVKARGGNDIGLGGAGNDVMTGGEGRDFLIGGTGGDDVSGNADDDLLIAGTTSFDDNRAALTAIQAEWLSSNTYAQRIANITNGPGGTSNRANGNFFLQADTTVFDDNAVDTLTGGAGSDWFIANTTGTSAIDVLNIQKSETSTDV